MNERENFLEAINHGHPDHAPYFFDVAQMVGNIPNGVIEFPMQGGVDAFGVHWRATVDGGIPDNRSYLMDDITVWRDAVKFPNLDSFPWESWAETELASVDRNEKIIHCAIPNGLFDRLVALMGFENGLIALMTEPDACEEFFATLTEYKIDYIDRFCEYYHPDVIQYVDDIAHARGLFMSPDTYRALIKPHHADIIKAIKDHGVIVEQHTCGKPEDVVPDFVEMGVQMWFPAQPSNDIKKIKETYGDRLAFDYGMDSQGVLIDPNLDDETLRLEVRKAVDTLGANGGLVVMPTLLGVPFQELISGTNHTMNVIKDELLEYSTEYYKKAAK